MKTNAPISTCAGKTKKKLSSKLWRGEEKKQKNRSSPSKPCEKCEKWKVKEAHTCFFFFLVGGCKEVSRG